MSHGMSRRGFVKGSSVTLAGMGLFEGAASFAFADEAPEEAWLDEADVIVVGGGGAGFAAAIEASRADVTVLILEKAGFCGGDTQLSNGMVMAAGTPEQESLAGCATDTPEKFADQQVVYAQGQGNEAMIREMCMESPDEVAFMRDLGRVYANCDIIPPVWKYDTEDSWGPRSHWDHTQPETHPDGHMGTLLKAVDAIDSIRIKINCEVAHLIVEDGQVVGVVDALGNRYRANRGVVLCTASFGANKEMNRKYNHCMFWNLQLNERYHANGFECHAANTGDGIRMAQEIGADLALSSANVVLDRMYFGGVGAYYYNTDYGIDYTNEYLSMPIPGKILVNAEGNRFVQEDAHWGYVNHEVYNEAMRTNWNPATEPVKVWAVQDSANMMLDLGSILYSSGGNVYADMCVSGETIAELAEKIGVPAENLERTVERWNEASQAGVDPDFDRRTDFGTIESGPFWAYPFIPSTMGSLGGLATDIEANVLDVNGSPIPRLYAAGTIMSGNWTAPFYSSCGWAILGTLHWGRKAGRNIAALDAWTTEAIEPMEEVVKPVPEPMAGSYNAGTYEAVGFGRNGEIPVTVEFSDDAILSVAVGENAETYHIGSIALDTLSQSVVDYQTADLDAVTGATLTSRGLLIAVDDCIKQATK